MGRTWSIPVIGIVNLETPPAPTTTERRLMFWYFLLLVGGCVLLYWGAIWLVQGASEIALNLHISKAIIGLSLVAFGTSAPELIVNLIAAYQGQTGFALTNVSGSNLTNLLVGFGLCGVITGLLIHWRSFLYDLSALVISALIPVGIMLLMLLQGKEPHLPFWSVLPLVAGLAAYLFTLARRGMRTEPKDTDGKPSRPIAISVILFLLGAITLYGGGQFVLDAAVQIAKHFQIDASLVGLTLVAAGTSIPDAIASIVAARRGEHDIAVGNLLGSNIANILAVITGTLLASRVSQSEIQLAAGTLKASHSILIDYVMIVAASLVFFGIAVRWGRITRVSGLVMIAVYLCYMGLRVYFELS